jgi:polar amino acid transport system substrate-binding protein
MSHEDVDVRTVLRSAVLLLSNTIRKSTQNFQTIYPEDLPHVHGNFRRLEQVFINLVQNACQALPDHARAVRVHAFYDGENRNVVVRVEDEGVGISESEASRITDPFYTTRRESGGTGLGLSVSLSIIQEHHGTLSFSSEPGEGACATVALPAVLETAKQRENASRKAEAVQKESEDAGLS